MAVILLAIGLLLTGIDVLGGTGIAYPSFDVDGAVGGHELSSSIRTYTVGNVLSDQVRMDYLPDVIGCVFILIGIIMLLRYNRRYLFAIPFLLVTMVSDVLLRVCGFIDQGPELVIWVLILYFALAAAKLLMEYHVVYSTAGITDTLVNRSFNTRMLFGWWITVLCRVAMVCLNFVGYTTLGHVYQVVSALATLFFITHLIRSRSYVGQCEPVQIRIRKRR